MTEKFPLLPIAILYLCLCGFPICAHEGAINPSPSILYLNSYHHGLEWSDNVYSGFMREIEDSPLHIRVSAEYMDSKFHSNRSVDSLLLMMLLRKHAQNPPQLIVTSDNNALNFVTKYRDEFFPNAPLVFCGINYVSGARPRIPNSTGIYEDISAVKTIEMIRKLHPLTQTIVFISDTTYTGRILQRRALADTLLFSGTVSFDTISAEPTDSFVRKLSSIPQNAAIIILSTYRNRHGQYVSVRKANEFIAEYSSAPVYSLWEHRITGGVIGGYVLQDAKHGKKAAKIVRRVLSGAHADDIPFQVDSVVKPVIDFYAAKAKGLKLTDLPNEYTIYNRPVPIYEKYRPYVLGALFVFAFQTMIVVTLLLNISRRKRAEKHLAENESYTRDIIANAPVPMAVVNRNGNFEMINKKVTEVYGYTIEEIPGILSGLENVYADGENREKMIANYKAQDNEQFFQGGPECVSIRCKDGSIRYVEFYFRKAHYDRYILVVHDITSQREAEKALRESERELRMMFENHSAILYLVDFETLAIIDVNEAACAFYGYSREQFKSMHVYDINVDSALEIRKKITVLNNRGTGSTYVKHRLANGDIRDMEIRASLIEPSEKRKYYFIIGYDITERIRMEEQLRHTEKMSVVGRLAGGIAHDFNNQLTGILGTADLLRSSFDTQSDHYALAEVIFKSARNASTLTHQLLTFARKGKQRNEMVDIHQTLLETLTLFSHSVTKKVTIVQDFKAPLSKITGDHAQLQNAFLNLAINARDAFDTGRGTIVFTTRNCEIRDEDISRDTYLSELSPGSYILVRVSDTGRGIDPEVLKHVFEPFFSTKSPDKGTGMGLSAAYGTVKNHNGAIRIESKIGKGTTVSIYLPLHSNIAGKRVETSKHQPQPNTAGKPGKTILVVDDEEIIRITAKSLLNCIGYTSILCSNGKDAVERFKLSGNEIDLVLIDMIMPGLDGAETISQLRKINPLLPAVISSGYSESSIQNLVDNRYTFSIQKPYTLSELKQKLAIVFSLSTSTPDIA